MFEIIAVLLYGFTAYLAALVVAVLAGSPLGAAVVFASVGVAYLFQIAQLGARPAADRRLMALMTLAILLLPLSVLVSLLEAYRVF